MYKVLIVEDEFNAREVLRKMLSLMYTNMEVVGEFASYKEAEVFFKLNKVDLAFFDIELEDGASVDHLKELSDLDFQVIFITSYSKYAIDAIKVSPIDYLLKPLDPGELSVAVEKALLKLSEEKELLALKLIEKKQEELQRKIVIKTSDNTFYLNADDIIMFEAEGAYTNIYTIDRTILTSRNLRHYENSLQDFNFARSHQKYMVNIKHVKKIDANSDIILTNDLRAVISTRKRSEIIKKLNRIER